MQTCRLKQLSVIAALLAVPAALVAQTPKFYPDDPLKKEPPPYATYAPQARALSEILELIGNTLGSPGERQPDGEDIPAGGVDTLGEVMDGPWFINRHATRRLSREELIQGAGTGRVPADTGAWQLLALKPYGFRPGMLVGDAGRQLYLLVFDNPDAPEVSTSAQVVASRILHAIGYYVPECSIVTFSRERLVRGEGAEIVSSAGNKRALTEEDVDAFLSQVARTKAGRYRAAAIRVSPPDVKSILGPYQMFGTRSDDPNDIVPHEHRRDLRGLFVIASWIDLASIRATSTIDVMVDDGVVPPHIRHALLELWSSLGGGYLGKPKRAWDGNDPLFDADAALKNMAGAGIWSPAWMRAHYPHLRGVGLFEAATFDPTRWVSIQRLAPFENRLPDDNFWGAKQVTAFTDEDIRALVSTGEYSDPAAADWIAQSLIARRDKIGATYFAAVLPLDAFRVTNGRLTFEDLGQRDAVSAGPRTYTARWSRFLNESRKLFPLNAADSFQLPIEVERAGPGEYYAVRIEAAGEPPERNLMVYLRTVAASAPQVVGIERGWPGSVRADSKPAAGADITRFASLSSDQQQLYGPYATADAAARGRQMTAAEHFDAQAISERTTYDAVTHALLQSTLTDGQGKPLGRSFDLIAGVERIAGQSYGRSGDLQFRLYVDLKPGSLEMLERAVEFFRDEENTVYHVGYPSSFRQTGKVPNLQFSVSADGLKADIDVDYRSSRMPQAMFNGHLTAANSDVRAGDNVDRHNNRWSGLIAWWRAAFGSLPTGQQGPQDTFSEAAAEEVPTPLPSDRRAGTAITQVEDAVQEFLTDWLVRRKIDEGLAVVSDRAFACVNVDDDAEDEALDARATRAALRETMEYVIDRLDKPLNLTEAIDAVRPVRLSQRLLTHAFEGEFSISELSQAEVAQYFCGPPPAQTTGRVYYGVVFRLKHADSGALGLLWTQENGQWKLLSFQQFDL